MCRLPYEMSEIEMKFNRFGRVSECSSMCTVQMVKFAQLRACVCFDVRVRLFIVDNEMNHYTYFFFFSRLVRSFILTEVFALWLYDDCICAYIYMLKSAIMFAMRCYYYK